MNCFKGLNSKKVAYLSFSPISVMMIFPESNVIIRQCVNKEFLNSNACKKAADGTEYCWDCDKDECNGAAQYGPAAIIVSIPIAIMKIFSLL